MKCKSMIFVAILVSVFGCSDGGDKKVSADMPHGEIAFCSADKESMCSMKLSEQGIGVENFDQDFHLKQHYFYLRAWFREKPKDSDVTVEFIKDGSLLKRKTLYDVDKNSKTHYMDLIKTFYGVDKKALREGKYCVKFYKGAMNIIAHGCFTMKY